jgi:hypothetical protein
MLGDLQFVISARSMSRSVGYKEGKLNIITAIKQEDSEILFNFHRDSIIKSELVNWLRMPVTEVQMEVERFIERLGITIEETGDENGTA